MIKKWETVKVSIGNDAVFVYDGSKLSDEEVFYIERIGENSLDMFLSEMGNSGWEPCAYKKGEWQSGFHWYFKREIEDETIKRWEVGRISFGGSIFHSEGLPDAEVSQIEELSMRNARDGFLAEMGDLGWELWSIANVADRDYHCFKREKTDEGQND